MTRISKALLVIFIGSLCATACFAQMYTVTDLGTLGGPFPFSRAHGVNNLGQVIGSSSVGTGEHSFRTSPNSSINTATDDLCSWVLWNCNFSGRVLGPLDVVVGGTIGINDSGQVIGYVYLPYSMEDGGFSTGPNSASPVDWRWYGPFSFPHAINASGQVVIQRDCQSYRIDASTTHNLGTLSTDGLSGDGGCTLAYDINDSGQVVGMSGSGSGWSSPDHHAFRTAANSPIDPTTDDLGTLGGTSSVARSINVFGQVVGQSDKTMSTVPGEWVPFHAFRTAPNSPINPATDDLGTLGGSFSVATDVNDYGQVVGSASISGDAVTHYFLYSGGAMHDLDTLIPADSNCTLIHNVDWLQVFINNSGQIAANGNCSGEQHAVRLDPIYKAFVQPPIKADGSSIFSSNRRIVPVKFALTQYDAPYCNLLPATISITRTAGATLGLVDESSYKMAADSGSTFRVDACEYVYNVAVSLLGFGTYRADISINGIMVGHAVFAMK